MKFKLLFFSLIVATTLAKSQNLSALEAKNGFRDFKLNSPLTVHKFNLRFNDKDEDGITAYEFVGELPNYNGWPSKLMGLKYYDNKLFEFFLYFKDKDGFRFKGTYQIIEEMFGQPTSHKSPSKSGATYAEWKSKNVSLSIMYIKPTDDYFITYTSVPLDREILLKNH